MKIVAFFAILFFFFSGTFAQDTSFVKVKNNVLTNGNDQPLFLKGVNLGGWLLWEEWMWGGGFHSETLMKTRLKEALGEEKYKTFLNDYYHNFITRKDIALLSGKGANCVRVPFNYRLFADGDVDGFPLIDSLVSWCKIYQVYVILDMHAAPGGQSPYFIADPDGKQLWQSDENKNEAILVWKKLAERYKNETTIAGYDLLNEPKTKNPADLVSFYEKLATEIRTVDPNHLLIIEGNNLAHDFRSFPSAPAAMDENRLYSFHYYAWFAEKKKQENITKLVNGIPGNGPLWCGEWGEDQLANLQEADVLLKAQPRVCGISFWSYKRVYTNNKKMPFCSVLPGSDWDKMVKWLTRHKVKPTAEEAEKATTAFLIAIRLENCTLNTEVTQAVL